MVYSILDNYIYKFNKSRKINIKEIGTVNIILFLLILISAVVACISIFTFRYFLWWIIPTFLEIVSCIIFGYRMQRFYCKNSLENISKKSEHYEEIKKWLEDLKYTDKNQIRLLCWRCRAEISRNNSIEKKHTKFIDRIFSLILIPISIAIITCIVEDSADLTNKLNEVIIIAAITLVLYVLIHGLIEFIKPLSNRTYIRMNEMVSEIQGMIDRKFSVDNDDIQEALDISLK